MGFFSLGSRPNSTRESSTATSSTLATSTSSRISTTKRSVGSSVLSFDQARNTIYKAIALCGLAGYSSPKTRQYLRTLPEFDVVLARDSTILKIEGKFYTLQKIRNPNYMEFINGDHALEEITPTAHRIAADETLQAAGPARASVGEEDDPITPEEELNRWKDTWTDECCILELEGRTELAGRFRADIEKTYTEALEEARKEQRRAENLRLFSQGSLERKAALVENAKSAERVAYKNHEKLLAKARAAAQGPVKEGTTGKV